MDIQVKITKSALLVFREQNGVKEVMFVRAGNKPYFVLPGGKIDPGETRDEALKRELEEELGVASNDAKYIGSVSGNTPDGRIIEEHIYVGSLVGDPKPQAEIAEIEWFSKDALSSPRDDMTPLTLTMVVPFIGEHGFWA